MLSLTVREVLKKTPSRRKRLSDAKKRVAIAKDALEQLRRGRYVAGRGEYMSPVYFNELIAKSNDSKRPNKCETCALGSLFLSRIALFNKWRWNDDEHPWGEGRLNDIFDEKQMALMEFAFEGSEIHDIYGALANSWDDWDFNIDKDEFDGLWSENFDNAHDCLEAILQNVVDHDGEFKWDVEYEVA